MPIPTIAKVIDDLLRAFMEDRHEARTPAQETLDAFSATPIEGRFKDALRNLAQGTFSPGESQFLLESLARERAQVPDSPPPSPEIRAYLRREKISYPIVDSNRDKSSPFERMIISVSEVGVLEPTAAKGIIETARTEMGNRLPEKKRFLLTEHVLGTGSPDWHRTRELLGAAQAPIQEQIDDLSRQFFGRVMRALYVETGKIPVMPLKALPLETNVLQDLDRIDIQNVANLLDANPLTLFEGQRRSTTETVSVLSSIRKTLWIVGLDWNGDKLARTWPAIRGRLTRILSQNITELVLMPAQKRILQERGIVYWGDLVQLDREAIVAGYQRGREAYAHIQRALEPHGLSTGMYAFDFWQRPGSQAPITGRIGRVALRKTRAPASTLTTAPAIASSPSITGKDHGPKSLGELLANGVRTLHPQLALPKYSFTETAPALPLALSHAPVLRSPGRAIRRRHRTFVQTAARRSRLIAAQSRQRAIRAQAFSRLILRSATSPRFLSAHWALRR